MTDYTERVSVIVEHASEQYGALVTSPQGAVLIAESEQVRDFAPQDLEAALERVREIEAEVEESMAAVDPPDQIAEIHRLFFDFDDGFISAQEALAIRAGAAVDWDELSESPEMIAYRTALAQDKQKCVNFRAQLNAISEQRGDLAETPWIPADLKEVFAVFLGCDGYPEHPDDLYRPPPSSNS